MDGEHVADDEHPHHQLGIDRRPPRVRVIGRQLLMDPAEFEKGVDLAHEVVRRHHVVKIERVEELALPGLAPPHHGSPPPLTVRTQRNNGSQTISTGVLQNIREQSGSVPGHDGDRF